MEFLFGRMRGYFASRHMSVPDTDLAFERDAQQTMRSLERGVREPGAEGYAEDAGDYANDSVKAWLRTDKMAFGAAMHLLALCIEGGTVEFCEDLFKNTKPNYLGDVLAEPSAEPPAQPAHSDKDDASEEEIDHIALYGEDEDDALGQLAYKELPVDAVMSDAQLLVQHSDRLRLEEELDANDSGKHAETDDRVRDDDEGDCYVFNMRSSYVILCHPMPSSNILYFHHPTFPKYVLRSTLYVATLCILASHLIFHVSDCICACISLYIIAHHRIHLQGSINLIRLSLFLTKYHPISATLHLSQS